MTKREREILEIIKKEPMITQQEIADKLDITRSSVSVHIANLMTKGYIKGRGYILDEDDYILVIGGANIDLVGFPEGKLIEKDSNPGAINISCGGVGRNIAENLVRLNLPTKLMTAIGKDKNGEIIIENARTLGLDLTPSLFFEDKRTATYMAILDEEQDLSLAISDMEIIQSLTPELMEKKKTIIENAKLVVLDTNLRQDTLNYLFENIEQNYFVDTVSVTKAKKLKNHLKYIDTMKPNIYEGEILSGIKAENKEDYVKIGKKLIDKGVKRVYLTLGSEGVLYFEENEVYKFNSKELDVENTIGAGDAFISGLVYGEYKELDSIEKVYTAIGASRVAIKDRDTISNNMNIENIKKEKEAIEYVKY